MNNYSESELSYLEGFVEKCAKADVDPAVILKLAAGPSPEFVQGAGYAGLAGLGALAGPLGSAGLSALGAGAHLAGTGAGNLSAYMDRERPISSAWNWLKKQPGNIGKGLSNFYTKGTWGEPVAAMNPEDKALSEHLKMRRAERIAQTQAKADLMGRNTALGYTGAERWKGLADEYLSKGTREAIKAKETGRENTLRSAYGLKPPIERGTKSDPNYLGGFNSRMSETLSKYRAGSPAPVTSAKPPVNKI